MRRTDSSDWKIYVEVMLEARLTREVFHLQDWKPLNNLEIGVPDAYPNVEVEMAISDSWVEDEGGAFQELQLLIAINLENRTLEDSKRHALGLINGLPLSFSKEKEVIDLSFKRIATWSFYRVENEDEQIYFEFGEGLAEAEYEDGEFESEFHKLVGKGEWHLNAKNELIWKKI